MSAQLSTDGVILLDEIKERGYAEFIHGIPNEQIEVLVGAYTDFTIAHPDPDPETLSAIFPATTPDLHKKLDDLDRQQDTQEGWHKYRTNAVGVGKPFGYTNRSLAERVLREVRGVTIPPEDPKEFYHYSPAHYARMARNHTDFSWGPIPPEVDALERAFRPIHARATELMTQIAAKLEETHPGVRKFFSPGSLLTSPIRLLFYHPQPDLVLPEGEELLLGGGHYDKGSWTIQLAESHLGLRVSPNEDIPMTVVERNSDLAVTFPAKKFADNFGGSEGLDTPFQPAWHDIVQVPDLNEGRSIPPHAQQVCARWALIFFANGDGFKEEDKALTHTR